MSDVYCSTGLQANYCPQTTDDALPAITGLLPPGPAWDSGLVAGTVQNGYWRSFANVAQYVYARLCAYIEEFFCSTVNESFDQWSEEYDLDNPCDAFGGNLCAKVTAIGGQTCAHFVASALAAGYVITCTDLAHKPRPIAGCFQVGCTGMGPTPVLAGLVYNDGVTCFFDAVIDHPYPQFWETTSTSLSVSCPVPGSNLGLGSGTLSDTCCMICGYYEVATGGTVAALPVDANACDTTSNLIYFGCNTQTFPRQRREPADSTGHWRIGFGDTYTWQVTVHLPLQPPLSDAGNFIAGCTPLCSDTANIMLCFLDQIKPAHATLVVNAING